MREKTKDGLLVIAFAAIVSVASVRSYGGLEPGKPEMVDRIERGALTYRVHCGSCHGATAKGDGPMAAVLKVEPADLRRLARRNDGRFPKDRIYSTIDGREEIRSHGPGSMPVWGLSFQTSGLAAEQEKEVRETILDLVAYLESIQEK
jgi:mono/diheme cytochrome c family protein